MKKIFIVILIVRLFFSCSNISTNNDIIKEKEKIPTNKVLLSSEIKWEKLNPARGDKSPQAGTIWGNRKGEVATGFLAKFVDDFSSPPHIHNVTYRAVVIKGLIHNDDPTAENMWMKPGSFWTQPAGESHITSANGEENIALVEINKGPYLVKPTQDAFESEERAINIDASNIVWLDSQSTSWVSSRSQAKISFLLEDYNVKSLFVKIPEAYEGTIETYGSFLHAVVIQGELNYVMPQKNEMKTLDIGSYFGAKDKATHSVFNNTDNEIIIYIRTNGSIKVN